MAFNYVFNRVFPAVLQEKEERGKVNKILWNIKTWKFLKIHDAEGRNASLTKHKE